MILGCLSHCYSPGAPPLTPRRAPRARVPDFAFRIPLAYIGADFLWDNLVTAAAQNGAAAAAGSIAVLALCVRKDMLWGSLLGVAGFQVAAWWQRQQQPQQQQA